MIENFQIKILVIEDNDNDIMLIKREFKNLINPYTMDVVSSESKMKELFNNNNYDLVISDFNLPTFNGLDALNYIRSINSRIPFILMSGVMGEEIAVSAMKAGASNYILKSNIKRLVPTLEKEVKEYFKIVELENKKNTAIELLDKASKMASIGMLTASITHEINQPLNAIKLGSEGILFWNQKNGNVIPEMIENMIGKISKAADKIDEIIKHMRQLIIDDEKIKYEKIKLNDIITRSILLLKNKISSNEIILELNLSENEIEIMADSIQLELIINNLIQNAIDSIKEKNIPNGKIEIKTYIDDYIIFEITDNGLGFDDEIKEKIFDPLFSTKHNKGGTGLGLAIVDRFLTRMGAKITAHNLNFNGALFKIKFNKLNV